MAIVHRIRASFAALAAGLLVAFGSPASAQLGPQVELNAQIVEGFIASYPEVKATADGLKDKYGASDSGSDVGSTWTAWLAYGDARSQLDGVVQKHGFADFQTWVNTVVSVAMAYSFAKDGGQMDASMKQAVDQINSNPSMSAAQKQAMIQQIQTSMGAVAAMKPPQANIDAVTPYLDQLTAVLK